MAGYGGGCAYVVATSVPRNPDKKIMLNGRVKITVPRSEKAKNTRHRNFYILLLILGFIFFKPTIELGLQELLPRAPARLGAVKISIPQSWMLSQYSSKIDAWKPCITMLCGSTPRASFTIEINRLPEGSDDAWENAARNVIHDNYSVSANSNLRIDSRNFGPLRCVELDRATANGPVVVSCLNVDFGLSASFSGDQSLKPVFLNVLASASKSLP